MLNPLYEFVALAKAHGWIDLGAQKNPKMISFKKEETNFRMNIYFTTMTVTLQSPDTKIQTYRGVTSLTEFEKIASSI